MKRQNFNSQLILYVLLALGFLGVVLEIPSAAEDRGVYEAPPFVPPVRETPGESSLRDQGNGIILDSAKGLMWTRKDSYAELKKCLNWEESLEYVKSLRVGGFDDWRMPSVEELLTLFDPLEDNVLAWDKNPDYPLSLSALFSEGAAYWYWSNECGEQELTRGCAKSVYFVNGQVQIRRKELCNNGGVRAVRGNFSEKVEQR